MDGPPDRKDGSLMRLRILVAEDQYMLARDLDRSLAGKGATVLGPAPPLERTMALLRTRRPDIAVLDVDLRGEKSFPAAEELARRGVPVIFMTGYEAWALPAAFRAWPRLDKPARAHDVICVLCTLTRNLPSAGAP